MRVIHYKYVAVKEYRQRVGNEHLKIADFDLTFCMVYYISQKVIHRLSTENTN